MTTVFRVGMYYHNVIQVFNCTFIFYSFMMYWHPHTLISLSLSLGSFSQNYNSNYSFFLLPRWDFTIILKWLGNYSGEFSWKAVTWFYAIKHRVCSREIFRKWKIIILLFIKRFHLQLQFFRVHFFLSDCLFFTAVADVLFAYIFILIFSAVWLNSRLEPVKMIWFDFLSLIHYCHR
jgi:hypothetical protein